MFRLGQDRAIINRMGSNNDGAAAIAGRLRRGRRHSPVATGVNIGLSKDARATEASQDFADCAALVASAADYVVVNVSSPNTPGLRALQASQYLRQILIEVRGALDSATDRHIPLLVKIAPDLSDDEIDEIADVALELKLDGLVAINTTTSRIGLVTPREDLSRIGDGGLSGPALKGRAIQVLQRLRARTGENLILVSVGGIEDANDAWERIRAGASLVQAYTAFVYGGPMWPSRAVRGLSRLVYTNGFTSIEDAVGTAVR
jgi:dihydroorotate dehydrogenase